MLSISNNYLHLIQSAIGCVVDNAHFSIKSQMLSDRDKRGKFKPQTTFSNEPALTNLENIQSWLVLPIIPSHFKI